MDPRRDDYSSTNGDLLRTRAEVGDDCHLTVVTGDRLAHNSFSDSILAVGSAQSLEKLCTIRIRIWVTMRQKYFVVIVLELDLESQCIVETTALLLKLVLEVADIGTVSVPSVAGATVLGVLFFLRIE